MLGSKAGSFDPIDGLTLADHFSRHLERALDLSFVRGLVVDCYAAGGRPSIDPVVFFKRQLVMFFEGLRSERQLMELAADRLSVRWYLGYDLAEPLPDHSSLTRIRDRFGIDVFRRFFDAIVEQYQQAGLVWGRELYIDATKVQANADLDSLVPRFAVDAHLGEFFTVADGPDELAQELLEDTGRLTARGQDLTASAFQSGCTQAEARHDWIARIGRPNRDGAYQRTADFRVSTTDQDATPMP
jgi:transposase